MGSPRGVPVPWDSQQAKEEPCESESNCAALSSACCAEPLGAVRLALRPSCRTAAPSTAAPAAPAVQPTPSLRTYPLARASHVLHRPSPESIPAAAVARVGSGDSLRLTA